MNWKTRGVIESIGGLEPFEQLVERGRQLHGRAVFDMFARLVSKTIQVLPKRRGITTAKQAPAAHRRSVCLKQT
jgi:hypothetical protein